MIGEFEYPGMLISSIGQNSHEIIINQHFGCATATSTSNRRLHNTLSRYVVPVIKERLFGEQNSATLHLRKTLVRSTVLSEAGSLGKANITWVVSVGTIIRLGSQMMSSGTDEDREGGRIGRILKCILVGSREGLEAMLHMFAEERHVSYPSYCTPHRPLGYQGLDMLRERPIAFCDIADRLLLLRLMRVQRYRPPHLKQVN